MGFHLVSILVKLTLYLIIELPPYIILRVSNCLNIKVSENTVERKKATSSLININQLASLGVVVLTML